MFLLRFFLFGKSSNNEVKRKLYAKKYRDIEIKNKKKKEKKCELERFKH